MDANDLVNQYPTLRHFAYDHLPPKLQEISAPFGKLALDIASRSAMLPQIPGRQEETDVAIRKLLEAKDAAVRAVL